MTQEEKAKAYDRALETARMYRDEDGLTEMEDVFPELAEIESEDERIRKELVNFILYKAGHLLDQETEHKFIAYLEKQKEQKPVEIHIDNPNIEKFDPDVEITTCDSSADGKELLYVSNKSYDLGFRDGVASVKPAELSEEDEERLNSIIESYKVLLKDYKACHDVDYIPYNSNTVIRNVVDDVNFLKSLRPDSYKICNSRWKPTEEQMEALNRCFLIGNEDMIYALKSLYDDLMKLK